MDIEMDIGKNNALTPSDDTSTGYIGSIISYGVPLWVVVLIILILLFGIYASHSLYNGISTYITTSEEGTTEGEGEEEYILNLTENETEQIMNQELDKRDHEEKNGHETGAGLMTAEQLAHALSTRKHLDYSLHGTNQTPPSHQSMSVQQPNLQGNHGSQQSNVLLNVESRGIPTNRLIGRPVNQSIGRPVNQSIGRPVNQSIGRLVNQSVNQQVSSDMYHDNSSDAFNQHMGSLLNNVFNN